VVSLRRAPRPVTPANSRPRAALDNPL